jgi:hypothetical protein
MKGYLAGRQFCVGSLLPLVARAQHHSGICLVWLWIIRNQRQGMFAHSVAEGRLFGFDAGDWSLLFGGFLLAGLLTLLA